MPGPDSFGGGGGFGTIANLWNIARTTPDSNSTIDTQIRLAREAGYTGTRPQLIAVGQGLLSREAFALGQGPGPGGDRVAPGPPRPAAPPAAAPPAAAPPSQLPQPWTPPATDQEWQDWQDESGTGSVPPSPIEWGWTGYNPPPTGFAPSPGYPGYVDVITRSVPSVITRVLGRILGPLGWILFPGRTAQDDTWGDWWPEPQAVPKGPPRRPRVGQPQPYGWPLPDFQGKWRKRPRVPGVLFPDYVDPRTLPIPRPTGNPWPAPGTRPSTLPRTPVFNPVGVPAPTTVPTKWTDLLPYVLPFIMPGPRTRNPFGPDPLTPSEPRTVDSPQPLPQYFAQPAGCPPCSCDKPKRKRKKDSCSNPISSKRTFTRGSATFRTITRRIECQASSRKKPQ